MRKEAFSLSKLSKVTRNNFLSLFTSEWKYLEEGSSFHPVALLGTLEDNFQKISFHVWKKIQDDELALC